MASPTDLDRLQTAWRNLQRSVNKSIPDTTDRVWAARNRLIGGGGGGSAPKPQ